MLADQLDYIVGVDPHRDSACARDCSTCSAARSCSRRPLPRTVRGTRTPSSSSKQHAPSRRAFAVEGRGSFGAGLTRFLTGQGERVLEVSRLRRERRSGGKTDALDAARAARSVLAQQRPATPRAGGAKRGVAGIGCRTRRRRQRQACRPLSAARPADHDTRAAAQRAAAADTRTAAAAPRSNTTRTADMTPSSAAACSRCARSPDACCN